MIHITALGIFDGIVEIFYDVIGIILFVITRELGNVLRLIDEIFFRLMGVQNVKYKGVSMSLEEVFVSNSIIGRIYLGMMLIGMVLCIVFTAASVIRKVFDYQGKRQETYGDILVSTFKAFVIMLIMTFVFQASLLLTRVLVERISVLFDASTDETMMTSITFSDEDYATMARVYNTIGNYSLNPSSDNRLNVNSCFNEIRDDLYILARKGVFDFTYKLEDADGNPVESWQSVLRNIALSRSLTREMPLDEYDEALQNSILHAMEVIRTGDLKILPSYTKGREYIGTGTTRLEAICVLLGTFGAAKDEDYNVNPSLTDAVRGPFYAGEKDILKPSEVMEVFYIWPQKINYLTVWVMMFILILELFKTMFMLATRIYNLLVLYIVAPLVVSVSPFDGGEKFKMWTSSFVGTVLTTVTILIPMRLFMVYIPIVMSSDLVLSDNVVYNLFFKAVLIIAGAFSVRKSTELLNQMTFNGNLSLMGAMGGADSAAALTAKGLKSAKQGVGKVARGAYEYGKGFAESMRGQKSASSQAAGAGKSTSGASGSAGAESLPGSQSQTGEKLISVGAAGGESQGGATGVLPSNIGRQESTDTSPAETPTPDRVSLGQRDSYGGDSAPAETPLPGNESGSYEKAQDDQVRGPEISAPGGVSIHEQLNDSPSGEQSNVAQSNSQTGKEEYTKAVEKVVDKKLKNKPVPKQINKK